AQQFLADLQGAGDVETITVYLNTVGGSFYDGLPIYNTLKQHKAHVTVKVMGYALSMGSVIMLAGDVVEAAENSLVMIHRAQGGVWGDAEDMAHASQVLQKHEQAVIPEYMRRLGKSEQDVMALLKAETWYTASEAKAAGLVDAVTAATLTGKGGAADMQAESWEYASQHFRNIPQAVMQRMNRRSAVFS
ncbi:head maturation protease, ClpP-related, partial [Candidatus Thiothrix sp. Deng01]